MTTLASSMSPPRDRPPVRARSAFFSLAGHARLWICAALGLTLDLWSKHWAFENLTWDRARVIWPDVLSFRLSLNPGALFGLGAGFAPLFIGASVLALMFVLYLFVQSTPRHRSLHVALGLVLAGALGNLYDRTMHEAYVVQDARGGARHIGKLLRDEGAALIIGDFPGGSNPHYYPRSEVVAVGYRPVVRDFIQFELKAFGHALWPWIFNIADALLVIGVTVLLINFYADHRRQQANAAY